MKRLLLIIIIVAANAPFAAAQTDESGDMRNISLDSVEIKGQRVSGKLRTSVDGASLWNMRMMDDLPKILGNADPMHYTQLLPSVQTNNEYDSGFHVQGCDNSHNNVTIEGVPIYNVTHLMGFFSVFNASHYPSLQLQTSAKDASYANRLGGFLTMNLPDKVQEKADGEFSVGLISSQGTLRLPFKEKHQLNVSVRASYLNLLYSQWLNIDGSAMRYSFYDTNLTYLYRHDERNSITLDCYLGNDVGKMGIGEYGADIEAKWGNHSIAAHWNHESDKLKMRNTLYNTRFHNNYSLDMNSIVVNLPSSICDYGFRNDMQYGNSHFGVDIAFHRIHPQAPEVQEGSYFNTSAKIGVNATNSLESSAFYDIILPLSQRISFNTGLRASAYSIKGSTHYALDPSASLTWETTPQWTNRLGFANRHQYLLQTGITSLGLPTTFWLSTGTDGVPVQSQMSLHLVSTLNIMHGRYSVNVELYYKWLRHQQEYFGTFYDFINTNYDLSNMLHHGEGRNYGVNVIFNKLKGKLTGWLSYSYGRAQRNFTDLSPTRWYPANHERLHEVNGVATYAISKRWSIGMTGVCASGTPFTAPRNFHIINGNIISAYGEHNANRLMPYYRIDVSANYKLKSHKVKESGLNFSIYNLTAKSNSISYYVKVYKGEYYYNKVSFLTLILPSISYYCKF